jgi:hypothetical protein
MDNQHTKIKGYRDLSQEEINLMNEIKEHAEKTEALLGSVSALRKRQKKAIFNGTAPVTVTEDQVKESFRCLDVAKTSLQQGQMWFVRAVALPNSF